MKIGRHYSKKQLYLLAFRDRLTGVYNRNALEEVRAEYDNKTIWVSLIDVDDLKFINDTYGQATGDAVIAGVARQLINISDNVIRLGGDEFLLLSEETPPSTIKDATIGSIKKSTYVTLTEAMHSADLIMYVNKKETFSYQGRLKKKDTVVQAKFKEGKYNL